MPFIARACWRTKRAIWLPLLANVGTTFELMSPPITIPCFLEDLDTLLADSTEAASVTAAHIVERLIESHLLSQEQLVPS